MIWAKLSLGQPRPVLELLGVAPLSAVGLIEVQGATNFLTGIGGFVQMLFFGYPQLRITAHGLSFNCSTVIPDSTVTKMRGIFPQN